MLEVVGLFDKIREFTRYGMRVNANAVCEICPFGQVSKITKKRRDSVFFDGENMRE